MAFSRIKRIKSRLKSMKNDADNSLRLYADFIDPGVWKSSENLGFLYKSGNEKKQKRENGFVAARLSKTLLDLDGTELLSRKIFAKTYRFKKKESALFDAGQLLEFTSRNNSVKIMNFSEMFLLTVYNSPERMQDYLNKREIWANAGDGCFPVPSLLTVDEKNQYIKEELLKKGDFSPEEAFEQVIADYQKLFSLIGKESAKGSVSEEDCVRICEVTKKYGIADLGLQTISFLKSENYRENLNHGDLNPPNLIYSGGKFYYIDFETVGRRWFFFDMLYYLAKSYRDNGSQLLRKYLNGDFDEIFSKMFRLNDAEYEPEKRRVYLLAFEMLFSSFGKYPLLISYKDLWNND